MGFFYCINLDDHSNRRTIYRCRNCHTHLFASTNIISDNFRGRNGKGYLVEKVVNFQPCDPEKRSMMTGDYTVCDTKCKQCKHYLGWRYLRAHNDNEKYKEGAFVMEIPQLDFNTGITLKKELF